MIKPSGTSSEDAEAVTTTKIAERISKAIPGRSLTGSERLGGVNAYQLFLFYSNRRPEDAPFLNTLNEL